MSLDTQSSEDRSKWTPERPKLVIDAKRKKTEWTERPLAENDVVADDEGGRIMRKAVRDQIAAQEQEKARRAAMEKAAPLEPSLDDVERAKLDGLRAELTGVQAADDAIPTWKKWTAKVFSGTDAERSAERISDLKKEIRDQEDLVRDLAGVLSNGEIDATIASMGEKDQLFNDRVALDMRLIARMVGLKDLFGKLGAPKTNQERDRAREALKRISGFGGKVQSKWALAGLRLLDGYTAAFPTRDDLRNLQDLERARELQGGPMEMVAGKWVPYVSEPSLEDRSADNDDRSDGTHTPPHIDSQDNEMFAK